MPHWHTIGTVWDSRSNSQTDTNSTFHFSSFQIVWFIIQDEEERPRPEFAAKAPYLEKNPITGVREPAFPKAVRCLSLTTNGGFLSLVAQDCFPIELKHTTKQFLPASFLYSSNANSSSWYHYWCFQIRLRRIAAGSGLIMLMVGPPMHLWSVVSMTKGRIFHICSCNQRKGTDQYEKKKYSLHWTKTCPDHVSGDLHPGCDHLPHPRFNLFVQVGVRC